MNYKELIERLRSFEIDHEPDGWPAIRMREISAMCDAIESLLAENERLNHNLTSTEQTMREYQELAAKRMEEIAKYRDAPVVAWEFRWLDTNEHTVTSGQWSTWERVMPRNTITTVDDHVAEIQYWINKGYKYELRSLIVKPGEDK